MRQGGHRMAIDAGHVSRRYQCVDDGFFGDLHSGIENWAAR